MMNIRVGWARGFAPRVPRVARDSLGARSRAPNHRRPTRDARDAVRRAGDRNTRRSRGVSGARCASARCVRGSTRSLARCVARAHATLPVSNAREAGWRRGCSRSRSRVLARLSGSPRSHPRHRSAALERPRMSCRPLGDGLRAAARRISRRHADRFVVVLPEHSRGSGQRAPLSRRTRRRRMSSRHSTRACAQTFARRIFRKVRRHRLRSQT